MRINLNPFDSNSIDNAVKQLNEYKLSLDRKAEKITQRLAKIGLDVASIKFMLADYDGVNDVTVTVSENGKKATLTASGQAVMFIEFGTGVTNPPYRVNPKTLNPDISDRGTYGKGKGANPNGWFYTPAPGEPAVRTYGNYPAEAMLTARDEVVAQIHTIAMEVFRNG